MKQNLNTLQPADGLDAIPSVVDKVVANKGAADTVRELNQARVASVVAPAQPITGAPILMPETAELYQAAVDELNAATKAEQDRLSTTLAVDASQHLFFVKCRYAHGNDAAGVPQAQHGIYLTKNPERGAVAWDEWMATYKSPKSRHNGEIICQVCFGDGNPMKGSKYVPLPVTFSQQRDGSFTVDERWLWKRHKKTGVESRVLLTRLNSANEWVERGAAAAAKKAAV